MAFGPMLSGVWMFMKAMAPAAAVTGGAVGLAKLFDRKEPPTPFEVADLWLDRVTRYGGAATTVMSGVTKASEAYRTTFSPAGKRRAAFEVKKEELEQKKVLRDLAQFEAEEELRGLKAELEALKIKGEIQKLKKAPDAPASESRRAPVVEVTLDPSAKPSRARREKRT